MRSHRPLRSARAVGARAAARACVLTGALVLALLCLVRVARADTVRLQADTRTVEVGTPIRVTLVALSERGESPGSPTLPKPPGVSVRGPTVSSQTQVSIMNGRMVQSQGINATWVLVPSKPGKFRVGPAMVAMGAERARSNAIEITVVPEGQGPPRGPGGLGPGFDPFGMDPFGRGFPGFGFPRLPGFDEPPDEEQEETADDVGELPEEYRVAVAKDPVAFLRADVQPLRAVVGEPVIYRAYAYGRMAEIEEAGAGEPATPDFVKYPVVENSADQPTLRGRIGEQVWSARKLRETLLVPIHTGRLRIGEITMTYVSRGGRPYGYRGKPVQRSTTPVEVIVTEPPLDGRPPGYQLGDVGSFTLSADVRPRDVSIGEALSVVIKLEGTGNLPLRLSPPAQNGLVWLEPNVTQEISARRGSLQGWRRFSYLVRPERAGKVELGRFALPFWDPAAKKYRTASVDLGAIQVTPGKDGQASAPESSEDHLTGVGDVRHGLGPAAVPPLRVLDHWWSWLVLASPLLVLSAQGLARAARALARRHRERGSSLAAQRARALREARAAIEAGERGPAATALERVLFLAVEEATQLRARGILRPALKVELGRAGVPQPLAERIVGALDRLDSVRFEGNASIDLASEQTGIQDLIAELRRVRPPRSARRPT